MNEPDAEPDTILADGAVSVKLPVTTKLPVICTCEPDANNRLDLVLSPDPLPTINADCAELDILYWPITDWYTPEVTVFQPAACE